MTSQRLTTWSTVHAGPAHMSIHALFERVAEQMPITTLRTVYEAVHLLEQWGWCVSCIGLAVRGSKPNQLITRMLTASTAAGSSNPVDSIGVAKLSQVLRPFLGDGHELGAALSLWIELQRRAGDGSYARTAQADTVS